MKTLKFKTNIKCGGCVATVTPHLEQAPGVEAWHVDTASPDKILTVETDDLSAETVCQLVEKAGFRAESLPA